MVENRATTPRTTLKRSKKRGMFDRSEINAILDESMLCHLGVTDPDGNPVVIPTLHARRGDELLLHGSVASRLMRTAATSSVCATISLIDGLVLAQTAFDHSANYRSVVIFGEPTKITDLEAADEALNYLVERLIPGRMADLRPNNDKELRATTVLSLSITEVSAKVRVGPPSFDPDEQAPAEWTGVLPIITSFGAPQTAETSLSPTPPRYLTNYTRSPQ